MSSSAAVTGADAVPRIGVRSGNPNAEFYEEGVGTRFSPGGFNYILLDEISNKPTFAHVTFDPGFYDATAAETALASIHQRGFNIVRVFIDEGDAFHQQRGQFGIEGPFNSDDLYRPVINNFVDFLKRAQDHRVYVMPVLSGVPQNRRFEAIVDAGGLPHIEANNRYYLTQGGIEAKALYLREFVRDVRSIGGEYLLPSIFAFEIQNETFLSDEWEPFSLHTGRVATADGHTYDMPDAASR